VAVSVELQDDERQRVADESEQNDRPEQRHVDDERERSAAQLAIHHRPLLDDCRVDGLRRRHVDTGRVAAVIEGRRRCERADSTRPELLIHSVQHCRYVLLQEAQLSPRDRATRRVS